MLSNKKVAQIVPQFEKEKQVVAQFYRYQLDEK